MKNSIVASNISGLIAMAGAAAPIATANATPVCYEIDMASERIVIDVEKQGGLVNPWVDLVALVFGGKQTAYSAHGKHVFAPKLSDGGFAVVAIAAVTGTVDVSAPYLLTPPATNAMRPQQSGAHMGLVAHWANLYQDKLTTFPVSFNCGSMEASSTPNIWMCNLSNESGLFLNTTLTKVNMADDMECNLFQAIIPNNQLILEGTMGPSVQ